MTVLAKTKSKLDGMAQQREFEVFEDQLLSQLNEGDEGIVEMVWTYDQGCSAPCKVVVVLEKHRFGYEYMVLYLSAPYTSHYQDMGFCIDTLELFVWDQTNKQPDSVSGISFAYYPLAKADSPLIVHKR